MLIASNEGPTKEVAMVKRHVLAHSWSSNFISRSLCHQLNEASNVSFFSQEVFDSSEEISPV